MTQIAEVTNHDSDEGLKTSAKYFQVMIDITKTCPCSKQNFGVVKIDFFFFFFFFFQIFFFFFFAVMFLFITLSDQSPAYLCTYIYIKRYK